MELSELNFAHPMWLWAILAIPLVWLGWFFFYQINRPTLQLEKFIDTHLLPYLLINRSLKTNSIWKYLLIWSVVWSCLTLALAGPRWNYREIETFSKDQSLVILLDLSNSMNATDIKPSRLTRAKQKIEDLLNVSKGVKVGLVAFAADPHMITPLTDDKETIRHLLPSLDTRLVYIQGSRLSPALDMAATMLQSEPGNNKSVLVMSDGGFEDATAIKTAKALAEKGVVIHAMGIGTLEGAPLKDKDGNIVKKNGSPVISKLEKERFAEISSVGKGHYLEPNYSDKEEAIILEDLERRAEAQSALGKINKIWEERYYILILPVLPILLWWFRQGFIIAVLLLVPTLKLNANAADYFKNQEQLGQQAFENGDFETAEASFQDPYRKGVVCYKAGKYREAEELFKQSTRPEVASSAGYNLGNALALQQKLKEAIKAYEDVLEKWPDHTKAKDNLEILKKMLEQQQSDNSEDQKNSENNSDKNEKKNQQDPKNNEESENQQESDRQDSKNNEGSENRQENDRHDSSKNEEGKKNEDLQNNPEQQKKPQEEQRNTGQENEAKSAKSQEDQDADLWLNKIENDPKEFMKNKFYIESKKNGATEGIDPW